MAQGNIFDQFDAAPAPQARRPDPIIRAAPDRGPTAYEVGKDTRSEQRNTKKDTFDQVTSLRSKFDALQPVQAYRVAIPQYAQALQTAPTPEGDLALTYAFAKAMDPDSVVREGEQAAVANADNLAGRVLAKLQNELSREGQFTPQKRAALRREIHVKIAQLQQSYAAQRNRFSQDAKAFGLDPTNVVGAHDGQPFHSVIREYWKRNNALSLPPATRGLNADGSPRGGAPRPAAPAGNKPTVSNW